MRVPCLRLCVGMSCPRSQACLRGASLAPGQTRVFNQGWHSMDRRQVRQGRCSRRVHDRSCEPLGGTGSGSARGKGKGDILLFRRWSLPGRNARTRTVMHPLRAIVFSCSLSRHRGYCSSSGRQAVPPALRTCMETRFRVAWAWGPQRTIPRWGALPAHESSAGCRCHQAPRAGCPCHYSYTF